MHLPGLDAEGLGHAGMVGAVEVDGEVAFIVAGLLAGLDPAEHAVGEHDHLQRHVAAHDGFQLAAGEAEAAVAHDRDHHGIGLADGGAKAGGHGKAQRPVRAVGDEVPAGLGRVEIGREVGAGRAGVGHHDGARGQQAVERVHHALGLDGALQRGRQWREEGLLGGARGGRQRGAVRGIGGAAGDALLHGCVQRLQAQQGVAHQGHVGAVVGAYGHGVHVQMDDGHLARGHLPVLGGGGAGACADEHHQIGLRHHGARGLDAAIGAHHAGIERMAARQAALAADAGAHGRVEQGGQRIQCGAGARDQHAAAADQHGGACRHQAVGSLGHGRRIGRGPVGRIVVMPWLGPDIGRIQRVLLHVIGQADMGGAGPARGHGAKGAAHGVRNLVHAVDGGIPLGQRPVQRLLVQFGQRELAACAHGNVRGDAQHGHRGFVGLGQAGQQVGGAAAAGAFAHAHLACDARIGVGHVAGAALVPREDVVHAVVQPRHGVVEGQAGVAAQAEDVLDAVELKHADHGVGAIESGGHVGSLQAGWVTGF